MVECPPLGLSYPLIISQISEMMYEIWLTAHLYVYTIKLINKDFVIILISFRPDFLFTTWNVEPNPCRKSFLWNLVVVFVFRIDLKWGGKQEQLYQSLQEQLYQNTKNTLFKKPNFLLQSHFMLHFAWSFQFLFN